MGRNATIHIQNETGHDLIFVSDHVEHGKFQNNGAPPETIRAGATGIFKVGNRTGAKIGPKGSVTYKLNYQSNIEVQLIFYWDHPFSASTSTYEVASNPPWFGSYYLSPPNPTGHDQELTFVTRLNDYGFDPKGWMEAIGNVNKNMTLRNLFVPGSHDSGTSQIHYTSSLTLDYENWVIPLGSIVGASQGWAKAQSNSVLDQLNAGIRYLDLRFSNGIFVTAPSTGAAFTAIGPDDPIPTIPTDPPQLQPNVVRTVVKICHSYASVGPESVFADIKAFLDAHPKEIIFVNFQHCFNFTEDTYNDILQQMKTALGDKLLSRLKSSQTKESQSIETLTLNDLWTLKKQIVVFFDQDHKVVKSGDPESGVDFKNVYPSVYAANDFIWQADDFLNNHYPNKCDPTKLKSDLEANVSADKQKFYVLQGILTPDTSFPSSEPVAYQNAITGKSPNNLEELGNELSPQVVSWVNNEWNNKPLNIIMLDWVCNSMVTQVAFMLNKYHANHPT
jgi:hypothetical protein